MSACSSSTGDDEKQQPSYYSGSMAVAAVPGPGAFNRQAFVQFQLPAPPSSVLTAACAQNQEVTVYEVLRIWLEQQDPALVMPVATPAVGTLLADNSILELHSGTIPVGASGSYGYADPTTIVHRHVVSVSASVEGTGYEPNMNLFERAEDFDLTDSDGNGIILTTPNFWFNYFEDLISHPSNAAAVGTWAACNVAFRILFRYKTMPVCQYLQRIGSLSV